MRRPARRGCYRLAVDFAGAASALSSRLSLDSAPVALAFLETPPEGVATADAPEPSSCSFWRRAEAGPLYATADAHMHCAVGAMVMGFELSENVKQDLMAAAEMMIGCGYLNADEVPNIPTITTPTISAASNAGILYGPLADFPASPDLVLVWLSPREAMRFAEAAGTCTWGSGPNARRPARSSRLRRTPRGAEQRQCDAESRLRRDAHLYRDQRRSVARRHSRRPAGGVCAGAGPHRRGQCRYAAVLRRPQSRDLRAENFVSADAAAAVRRQDASTPTRSSESTRRAR